MKYAVNFIRNIYFSLGSLNSFIDNKRYLSANIIDNKLPNIFPKENNIKYKLPEVKKLINTGSIIIWISVSISNLAIPKIPLP